MKELANLGTDATVKDFEKCFSKLEAGVYKVRTHYYYSKYARYAGYLDKTTMIEKASERCGFEIIMGGNDAPRGGKKGNYLIIQKK